MSEKVRGESNGEFLSSFVNYEFRKYKLKGLGYFAKTKNNTEIDI